MMYSWSTFFLAVGFRVSSANSSVSSSASAAVDASFSTLELPAFFWRPPRPYVARPCAPTFPPCRRRRRRRRRCRRWWNHHDRFCAWHVSRWAHPGTERGGAFATVVGSECRCFAGNRLYLRTFGHFFLKGTMPPDPEPLQGSLRVTSPLSPSPTLVDSAISPGFTTFQ